MVRFAPLALLLIPAPAHADERSFLLTGFDRIRVDGPYQVIVTTGGSAGASAQGDARAIDSVNVRVNGTTLVITRSIETRDGYANAARTLPSLTVSTPALRGAVLTGGGRLTIGRMAAQRVDVSLTGAGTIDVAEVDADHLNATLVGTGALKLAGRALDARFQSNGAGSIDADGLTTGTLAVDAQSAGDSRFNARTSATIAALGSGTVSVGGTATCTVQGAGPVACAGGGKPQ
jgi:hypothetical protein